MNAETLQARAAAVQWWHGGIDLGQGVVTVGRTYPANSLLPYLGLPADLSGKTVADICAWDGYMAFECERRGARVTAVDSWAWDKSKAALTTHDTGRDGFDLAREARSSSVTPVRCEVLDLDPKGLGTFDIVLFLGVLYHMRHPLLALEKVAALADDLLIVESHVAPDSADPLMVFIPGAELNRDPTNWWAPNVACVKAMLHDVGFAEVTVTSSVASRAVFQARRAA
jgi:tRNA (mo5U34)-methyltransferase